MKKTLVVLLIFLVFIAGYFYFNKPQPILFKGVADLHLAKVTDEASEIRGDLVFHNPNKMRSQLGKVNFDIALNGTVIGKISDNFATAIKGEEDFHYSFQVRFPVSIILDTDPPVKDVSVTIAGMAGSDVLFANYIFPLNYSGTIKNIYR
jgi:hypothetical protein